MGYLLVGRLMLDGQNEIKSIWNRRDKRGKVSLYLFIQYGGLHLIYLYVHTSHV